MEKDNPFPPWERWIFTCSCWSNKLALALFGIAIQKSLMTYYTKL